MNSLYIYPTASIPHLGNAYSMFSDILLGVVYILAMQIVLVTIVVTTTEISS